MNKFLWLAIGVLTLVVFALAWILFATPAHAPTVETETPSTVTPPPPPPAAVAPLHDRVIVTSPKPGATVAKTFSVTGEAPGNWYFEASFPVKVLAPNGDTLASLPCQAQKEWMTNGQVPFKCEVTINSAYKGQATLVIMKDNPSGLPENEDAIDFQITVK